MRKLILATAVVALSGCASIISDSKYPVSVASTPAGASYEIRNKVGRVVSTGTTPDQVTLDAGAGYFSGETYQVTYRKDGYNDQHSVIESGVDGWYWANIVFGGLIGMLIVDPATGAMYTLPDSTGAGLYPVAVPVAPAAATTQPVSQVALEDQGRDELLNELANDESLSYDEYQRRYNIIMRDKK